MLAKTKMAKLIKQLDDVQKGCSARCLNEEVIVRAIEKAEEAVKDVRPELRTSVIYQYSPHWVAKSYGYPAEGTALTVLFSKSGKAILAGVSRQYVNYNPKDRLVLIVEGLTAFIEEELGVEHPGRGDADAIEKYITLREIVAKASGFDHNLMRRL